MSSLWRLKRTYPVIPFSVPVPALFSPFSIFLYFSMFLFLYIAIFPFFSVPFHLGLFLVPFLSYPFHLVFRGPFPPLPFVYVSLLFWSVPFLPFLSFLLFGPFHKASFLSFPSFLSFIFCSLARFARRFSSPAPNPVGSLTRDNISRCPSLTLGLSPHISFVLSLCTSLSPYLTFPF